MDAFQNYRCVTKCHWDSIIWQEYDLNPAKGRATNVPASMALQVPHHFVCEDPAVEEVRRRFFAWMLKEGAKLDPSVLDEELPKKRKEFDVQFAALGGDGAALFDPRVEGGQEPAVPTPKETVPDAQRDPAFAEFYALSTIQLREKLENLNVTVPAGTNKDGLVKLLFNANRKD